MFSAVELIVHFTLYINQSFCNFSPTRDKHLDSAKLIINLLWYKRIHLSNSFKFWVKLIPEFTSGTYFNSYFLHVLFFILSSAMCKWISICHRWGGNRSFGAHFFHVHTYFFVENEQQKIYYILCYIVCKLQQQNDGLNHLLSCKKITTNFLSRIYS